MEIRGTHEGREIPPELLKEAQSAEKHVHRVFKLVQERLQGAIHPTEARSKIEQEFEEIGKRLTNLKDDVESFSQTALTSLKKADQIYQQLSTHPDELSDAEVAELSDEIQTLINTLKQR